MFRKISILSLLMIVTFFSDCKKKSQTVQDNIAYQTVNITLYPNDPLYFKLQTAGGWVYMVAELMELLFIGKLLLIRQLILLL